MKILRGIGWLAVFATLPLMITGQYIEAVFAAIGGVLILVGAREGGRRS